MRNPMSRVRRDLVVDLAHELVGTFGDVPEETAKASAHGTTGEVPYAGLRSWPMIPKSI